MATETKSLDVCGDILAIRWDGNTWVSPSNGQQHSTARSAMRREIEAYFSAGGEDVEDKITSEEIDGYLSQMD